MAWLNWILVSIALLLGGCGMVPVAKMKLAPELQSGAQVVEIAGLIPNLSGSYTFGRYSGTFSRSASATSLFNGLRNLQNATVSYAMNSQTHGQLLSADCTFGKSSVNTRLVSFDTQPFNYECAFTSAVASRSGRLRLGERKSKQLVELAQTERLSGEMQLGQLRLRLVSVHQAEGGAFPINKPLGYQIFGNGRVLGAVQVADFSPKVHFLAGLSDEEHIAVAAASLALGVFMAPPGS